MSPVLRNQPQEHEVYHLPFSWRVPATLEKPFLSHVFPLQSDFVLITGSSLDILKTAVKMSPLK